jgi:hypothetical protein
MSGEIVDDRFGADNVGATCRLDGMAYLVFDGDRVIHDEEYFDRDAASASLSGAGYCRAVFSAANSSNPPEVTN